MATVSCRRKSYDQTVASTIDSSESDIRNARPTRAVSLGRGAQARRSGCRAVMTRSASRYGSSRESSHALPENGMNSMNLHRHAHTQRAPSHRGRLRSGRTHGPHFDVALPRELHEVEDLVIVDT